MARTRTRRVIGALPAVAYGAWAVATLWLKATMGVCVALAALAIVCVVVSTRWREYVPQKGNVRTRQPWQGGAILIAMIAAMQLDGMSVPWWPPLLLFVLMVTIFFLPGRLFTRYTIDEPASTEAGASPRVG